MMHRAFAAETRWDLLRCGGWFASKSPEMTRI